MYNGFILAYLVTPKILLRIVGISDTLGIFWGFTNNMVSVFWAVDYQNANFMASSIDEA